MNDKNIKAYLHTTKIAIATNEIIDQYKMDTKQAQWIKQPQQYCIIMKYDCTFDK